MIDLHKGKMMQKRYAKILHNEDEVQVRVNGFWSNGYVVGDVREIENMIIIDVQSELHGYIEVSHLDIR